MHYFLRFFEQSIAVFIAVKLKDFEENNVVVDRYGEVSFEFFCSIRSQCSLRVNKVCRSVRRIIFPQSLF